MKIIKPYTELYLPMDGDSMLKHIELCGRVCYKSEERITDESAPKFVADIIRRGHEAVLEHCSFTVRFVCDRGVSHELVRHRLASFCQESTRYCDYSNGKHGSEIKVIDLATGFNYDLTKEIDRKKYDCWQRAMDFAEQRYLEMVELGASAQEARSVLPNSLKTEVTMTMNLREARHFFKLRTAKAAHPSMRELTIPLLMETQSCIPVVFDDIMVED